MASAINFDKFDTEYHMKKIFKSVAEIFRTDERYNNPEPGTPFHTFLDQLQLGPARQDQDTPFDFELGEPLTIDQAAELCENRVVDGVPARIGLATMLLTNGNRLFFNRNMGEPHDYVEISRPENSDYYSEKLACTFLNSDKSVIDWTASLPQLKKLGKQRLYTSNMMREALLRLLRKHQPECEKLMND